MFLHKGKDVSGIESDASTLRVFLAEAEEIIDQFKQTLHKLELAQEKDQHKFIELAFRLIHTIKGSSSYMQSLSITSLCTGIEELLAAIRKGDLKTEPATVSMLEAGCDKLAQLIMELPNEPQEAVGSTNKLLQTYYRVLQRDEVSKVESLPKEVTEIAGPLICHLEYHGQGLYALDLSAAQVSLAEVKSDIETIGALVDEPRPKFLRFRTILSENMTREALDIEGKHLHLLRSPPEEQLDEEGEAVTKGRLANGDETMSEHMGHGDEWTHVSVDDLAHAVEMASEAQGLYHHLADHLAAQKEDDPISWAFLSRLGGITAKLSHTLADIWWIPIGRAFEGLPAITRKACLDMGKEVELFIKDSTLDLELPAIRQLRNILVHIVRNSLAHGIESPKERRALGKPPMGTLSISAIKVGTWIQVKVEDDGQGLDVQKIKERAIAKGLMTQERAVGASKAELLALLFAPAFTTTDEVNDTAGRGVGLDAVKEMVEQLQGHVCLTTEKGRGTTVTICLPARLPQE